MYLEEQHLFQIPWKELPQLVAVVLSYILLLDRCGWEGRNNNNTLGAV